MRATREDGTASTVHRCRPAGIGALASILVLTAIALVGCTTHDATGSAGSTAIDGGVGLSGPGDGAAPLLQVSIEPAAPTVCPGGCVSLSVQAAGAAPPYAIAWSGLQGDGSTVQVCPAATTTYAVTVTAGAAGRGGLVSQETTGSASVTVTVTPSCAGDGGTTDGAAAAVDSGQEHEICSQSWSAVATNNPSWKPGVGALALDGVGNLYVAAIFTGTMNVAGQTLQSTDTYGLLVVKLDPACKVLWARAFGAPKAIVGLASMAVDATGNVVVTGSILDAPVDFGSGTVALLSSSYGSGVVFKLGPDGKGLWSRAYQASALSRNVVTMAGVAIDSLGNTVFGASMTPFASVKGTTTGTLPASIDFGGGAVAFGYHLVELDANGQFVFDRDVSSASGDVPFEANSLATDSTGRIWAAGGSPGRLDLVAFDAGGHPQWARNVSATGYANEWEPAVRLDANDEVFTAAGWAQAPADGGWLSDPLLYKFSASGSPSWTPPAAIPQGAWGPLDQSSANPIWAGGHLAVDPSGRALVSSEFNGSADFGSVGTLTSAGGFDSVVLRFDAQGRLIGGGRWGGADDDVAVDVAVDSAGDAVIAGWTVPVGGNGGSQSGAPYALFVAKLGW